jgi:hypothetical protein
MKRSLYRIMAVGVVCVLAMSIAIQPVYAASRVLTQVRDGVGSNDGSEPEGSVTNPSEETYGWPNVPVVGGEYHVMSNLWNDEALQGQRDPSEFPSDVDRPESPFVLGDISMTVDDATGAFTIDTFTANSYNSGTGAWIDERHFPSAYPAIYKGCHHSQCTIPTGSDGDPGLGGPLPMQIRDLGTIESYWDTSVTGDAASTGVFNVAYDIWLDIGRRPYAMKNSWQTSPIHDSLPEAASVLTQPYGTEVMIWINNRGYDPSNPDNGTITPAGERIATDVTIPNVDPSVRWDVWVGPGRDYNDFGVYWNIVSFVRRTTPDDLTFSMDTQPFIEYLLSMGNQCPVAYNDVGQPISNTSAPCALDTWWLVSIQAGFEIWADGAGLQSNAFSVKPIANKAVSSERVENGITTIHFQNYFQLWKNAVCSDGSVPEGVNYSIEADEFDPTDGSIIGRKTINGSMDVMFDTYYYTIIEPLHDEQMHGNTFITFETICNGTPVADPPINIYIDPSGQVHTLAGGPIAGATVTLFRSDSAGGPFVQVPDGSDLMSPRNRTNPDLTNESGSFGWDVQPGFYKVRAEKEGCYAPGDPSQTYVETEVLEVPPPVFNLDLRLECPPPDEPGPELPVEVTTFTDWGTGYCANVVVTNNTSEAVDWVAVFEVEGEIYDAWNFGYVLSGDQVIATGVEWNRTLQPGESTHSVGFCANRSDGGGGSGICEVTYNVRNQWNWGFTTDITLKNTSPAPINGWTLAWTFPNGQVIYEAWGSLLVTTGPNASIRNASWNANLAPGQTVGNIGFNAYHFGVNDEPVSFTLNGQSCTVK